MKLILMNDDDEINAHCMVDYPLKKNQVTLKVSFFF